MNYYIELTCFSMACTLRSWAELLYGINLMFQYGLYSAFMGCFVYVFFGTAKDITLGPTAIMSLMTADFGASPVKHDATYAILLCLFSGIVQIVMGIFQLGKHNIILLS